MFTYQKTNRYFAQIGPGLEKLGAAELAELGAREVKTVYKGIYFDADLETLYRIHYSSRLITRIFAQLLRFDCHSTKYLYKTARRIKWHKLLSTAQTFAITATVSHSRIKHSRYAALCLKDAIADSFRERQGSRPDVDANEPDVRFNLHIERNRATVNLETSGGSLHRRGYRKIGVEAPMQETVAAAIIRLSGWQGDRPLADPMCGSGTLLCEALMHYCRIPAAYLRPRFGFELMPEFDPDLLKRVKDEANSAIRRPPAGLISGSDIDPEAVRAAVANSQLLPHGSRISIKVKPFHAAGPWQKTVIVTNPPYGIRLKQKNGMEQFLLNFFNYLKRACRDCTAHVYFGKPELVKRTGVRPDREASLMNGGLAGLLASYKIR